MLTTLDPPPPVFSDQLPILRGGMNCLLILPTSPNNVFGNGDERLKSHYQSNGGDLILPTSPNNVFDSGDERLKSHYPSNGSDLILPTSPNSFLDCDGDLLCQSGERLMSHYSMIGSDLALPTSPNNILNREDNPICPSRERSMSYYPMNGSSLVLPTSPNNFLNGENDPIRLPNERLMSHYPMDGSSFILPTSPNSFPSSPDNQNCPTNIRRASTDGSSLILPTSPNNFLISWDDPNCPSGERLITSHYPTNRSTTSLVLPTSPNNFISRSEDNRFCPSDERLLSHYLKQKMLGNEDQVDQIPEVDILSREPWDLLPTPGGGEQCYKEAYYFCRRRSYFKSKDRYKRTTGDGYWKPTGKPRDIRNGANREVIGSKRCLVFHFGRSVGQSTGYTMHEYSAAAVTATGTTSTSTGVSSPQPAMDLVLCKVMKKGSKPKAATKRSNNKKAKTVSASPPPSDENVNTITQPPLQREAEEAPANCQMASDFGNQDMITSNSHGGIEAFPDIDIDSEEFRLPSIDFKFDFEPSDVLQQPPLLEAEYFPGMVQQSG